MGVGDRIVEGRKRATLGGALRWRLMVSDFAAVTSQAFHVVSNWAEDFASDASLQPTPPFRSSSHLTGFPFNSFHRFFFYRVFVAFFYIESGLTGFGWTWIWLQCLFSYMPSNNLGFLQNFIGVLWVLFINIRFNTTHFTMIIFKVLILIFSW